MNDDERVSTTLEGFMFHYYPRSGGMVVTTWKGRPIDAGLIGNAGSITRDRLNECARVWVRYRKQYEAVKAWMDGTDEKGRRARAR
jgi:hypothetical protein